MTFTRCLIVSTFTVLAAGNLSCRSVTTDIETTAASQLPLSDNANESTPSDPAQRKISLLEAQATLCEMDNKTGDAVQLYETILQTDPKHVAALHRLAILHSQQGYHTGAEACFQKAIELAGDSATLHNDYGYYCHLQGKTDAAIFHLRQALAQDPQLLEAHNNLGMVYARMGRFGEAEFEFQQAGCSRAEALNNLGLCRLMDTDYDGAAATYELALQQDPNLTNARRAYETLNKISQTKPAVEPRTVSSIDTVTSEMNRAQLASYVERPNVPDGKLYRPREPRPSDAGFVSFDDVPGRSNY